MEGGKWNSGLTAQRSSNLNYNMSITGASTWFRVQWIHVYTITWIIIQLYNWNVAIWYWFKPLFLDCIHKGQYCTSKFQRDVREGTRSVHNKVYVRYTRWKNQLSIKYWCPFKLFNIGFFPQKNTQVRPIHTYVCGHIYNILNGHHWENIQLTLT